MWVNRNQALLRNLRASLEHSQQSYPTWGWGSWSVYTPCTLAISWGILWARGWIPWHFSLREWLVDWALEVRESPSAGNAGAGSALKGEGREVLGGPLIVPCFISLIRLRLEKGAGLEQLGVGRAEPKQLEAAWASLPSWSFTSGLFLHVVSPPGLVWAFYPRAA